MVYTSEAGAARRRADPPRDRCAAVRIPVSRGATVLRGMWGFHGDHEPHGDKWMQLARRVPVTTIVVDTPDRIAASFEIIDELTSEHGLVTCELVPALVSIDGEDRRGGTELARYEY